MVLRAKPHKLQSIIIKLVLKITAGANHFLFCYKCMPTTHASIVGVGVGTRTRGKAHICRHIVIESVR